jgi:hypothetical protein
VAPLKPFISKPEDVEESLRPFYKKREDLDLDILVLDVVPQEGWSLEDVRGLKSSLGRARDERRTATERVTNLEADILQLNSKLKAKVPDDATKLVEAALKERDELHKTETEKITNRSKKLQSKVEALLVDSELTSALVDAGVKKNMLPLILTQAKSNTRVREEGDDFVVEVLQGGYAVADKTLKDLVGDYVNLYPEAFEGSGGSGSGASNNDQNRQPAGGKRQPKHRADFTNAHEKAVWIKENGQDKLMSLPPAPAQ